MKRNFRLTLYTLTLAALATGCGKKFLNIAPQGAVTEEEIRNNPNAAQDLVNGVYNIMWIGGFEPDINSFQFIIMTEIASDNADKGSTPDDYQAAKDIDNFTLDSRNGVVSNVWKGHYQAIARANQALDKIPLSPLDDAKKNALLGEVRFLRAHFYFNLVRFFGGVPKIDRVPNADEANSDQFQTRASVDTIYNMIIEDLTFAVNNLPLKGATQVGRATKGAAQGLLAKVYLYRKNWQGAFDMSQAVINSGLYDTLSNYANIWRVAGANSSESLFEVQTGVNAACNAAINIYSVCQGPRAGGKRGWTDLGFGFNNPSANLVAAYEVGDKRAAATIITVPAGGTVLWDGFRIPGRDSVENDRYNYKAYHSRTQEPYCGVPDRMPKNHRVLRYSDVLLIYAEAANELGNIAEAQNKLNMVRRRAGLGNFTGTQATLRTKIWDERRVELAMECDRFFDIVRQGRAGVIMRAAGKAFQDGKHELFPIPEDQRELSGNRLGQNNGYN
ncbi:RagB/SusD family nutrient uptake outer membrane protein [Chitinophaga sedimenti]|uniref:RagB/SusD family nutrient uptake outer membrane protein n=1 Tax=Chitinophaga sedimenti TaxID=2033606 RepID=UPI0020046A44|nr:RagB/SusD family nutrient uptake outer membrane protein [Chitinophaga sedimenti]MCK7557442.1 RagB/SusD family nutrient uptake outer membrane protein [Chitinophaga sedimenti]